MIHEILMVCPHHGGLLNENRVIEWKKQPGDKIVKGETILVVECDKANLDFESFIDGYLAVILVRAGEEVPIGNVVALIAETRAEIEKAVELSIKYRDR